MQAGGRATLGKESAPLYGKESAPLYGKKSAPLQPGKTREWNGVAPPKPPKPPMRRQRRPCTACAASAAFAAHATWMPTPPMLMWRAPSGTRRRQSRRSPLVRLVTEPDFNASKEKAQTLNRGTATVLYI